MIKENMKSTFARASDEGDQVRIWRSDVLWRPVQHIQRRLAPETHNTDHAY